MKVLIPTDGSTDAQSAVRTALRLLSPEDREIDLLCVAPAQNKIGNQVRERVAKTTRGILERARELIGTEAARAHLIAACGSPARVIVARAPDYDLTVIGAKGRAAGANVGLGPVASRVVEHTVAPLLIARELRSESGARILVAADGSRASLSSITELARLFDLRGSEITLMHVSETPWVHFGLDSEWATSDEDVKEKSDAGVFEKELTRESSVIVEQARDLLISSGAAMETMLDEGNPADEILSESDRGSYDLIVLGASGNRDLKHSMLGSVSFKVAWNAPCSVLIVREPV